MSETETLRRVARLRDREIEWMAKCDRRRVVGEGAAVGCGKVAGFRWRATGGERPDNPYLGCGPRHHRFVEAWEDGFDAGEQAYLEWAVASLLRGERPGMSDTTRPKRTMPGTRKSQEFRPEDLTDVSGATLAAIQRAAAQGDEYSQRVLKLLEREREAMGELARLREEELQYFGLELDARQASLEGREDEAAAIRLQLEHERELAQRPGSHDGP